MEPIEAEIQHAIIDILPNAYESAMRLLCQLLANMALSGDEPWPLDKVLGEVTAQYNAYQACEGS